MNGEREPDLIDAMLDIIRCPSIDGDTARMAATVISIDANFNARVTNRKKQGIEKDDLFYLLDFAEGILGEARAIASAVEQGIGSQEAGDRLRALRSRIAAYDV